MINENHVQHLLFSLGDSGTTSQNEAESILEPFAQTIMNCLVGAFEEFDLVPEGTRSKVYPGTRGQFITNLIWERIRDGLTGKPKIGFCDRLGFFKVIIDDRIIVRFKRLNRELLAASEDTEQAIRWFANEPLRNIPNHLLRLNFGYQPSWGWKSCSDFYLTHQSSFTHLEWASVIPSFVETTREQEEHQTSSSHGMKPIKFVPIARLAKVIDDQKELG